MKMRSERVEEGQRELIPTTPDDGTSREEDVRRRWLFGALAVSFLVCKRSSTSFDMPSASNGNCLIKPNSGHTNLSQSVDG